MKALYPNTIEDISPNDPPLRSNQVKINCFVYSVMHLSVSHTVLKLGLPSTATLLQ